jgi:hypothetical protein
MLSSLLGIRLLLCIGKTVPRPASYEVMNALTGVEVTNEVTNDVEQPGDGFQLSFTIGKNKRGEYSLLQSGALDPDARVIIGVLLGVTLQPLIDGVIFNHQVSPGEQPGTSTLTVSGRDISVMLDLEEKDRPYKQQSDSTIVSDILKNYDRFGILPFQVTPTTDVPSEADRIPGQHETDLKFIHSLAQRNGFVFYIEPVTMGVNRAYWGPENRSGRRQPALTYDMGPSTNVTTLRLMNDALAPIATSGTFVEPITKTSIRIPALPSLRIPPLTSTAGSARRTERLRCTANRNPAQAATAAQAAATRASEPVTAEGELDTVRYGSVLRARRLVGVRGVGRSYNGAYFVRSVTHKIQPGVYTQTFKLSREGTGALARTVCS